LLSEIAYPLNRITVIPTLSNACRIIHSADFVLIQGEVGVEGGGAGSEENSEPATIMKCISRIFECIACRIDEENRVLSVSSATHF